MVVCAETSRRRRRRRLTTMQPQHAYCYGSEHHPEPPHHRDPPPMVLHRDMLHQDLPPHRDPPPYPGQFRPLYQPGYRQSYSGSETSTDLSLSSTENLSTFTRQDPQGEETTAGVTTPSMDPWDNLLGEVSYSQLSQLSHLAAATTSGVEVKATNSGTFYVTGSRPTSASPNQELLYWSGEGQLQTGGFYGTNMFPGRTVLAQQGCYPQSVCVAASGKTQHAASSGMRPRSAHGAPGGRRKEPVHMVPRPASVNASPIPGIYALEGSPPPLPISVLPNVTSRSKPVRSTATASVAVTAASTTAAIAPIMTAPAAVMPGGGSSGGQTMPMSFPPPPQYPGPGGTMAAPSSSPAAPGCLDMTRSSGGGVNANGIMTMPTANVASKMERQQQRPTTKAMSSSSSSSSTTSPTGSTDSSPMVSGAESPLVRGTNSGPTTGAAAAALPYPGPVLHPPTNANNKTASPVKNNFCHSYEVGESRTTAHPDILCHNDTTAPARLSLPPANKTTGQRTPSPQPSNTKQQGQQNGIRKGELDHATIAARATKMVERLSQENRQLRQELEGYCRKVTKLQKFEIEIQKVHDSYESLVKQSQRRESLEKIMRFKLEAEVRKLTETNKELKDQLNKALSQLEQKQVYDLSDSELKKEIQKKDSMISKLISQNKELNAAKERLEIEIAAQRSTLQEQRAHIDVLNTAIVNAQSQSLRLEEEAVRKAAQDDVVTELQRAVAGLQLASDKKDSLHQRLLAKLEEEISNLQGRRLQVSSSLGSSRTSDTDEGIASDSEPSVSVQTLIQQLRKKEQRILQLEVNVVKLEERYLEEHALRQLAVDAASFPKDARIAALEQNSTETGKVIAEAKTDRLKHLEELYQANRKVAEVEAKVKTCQAQLAEKDAMIAVMQKHNSLSRASSLSSLLYSPLHSPHPSLASSLTSSLTSSSLTSSLTSSAMSMSSSSAPVSSPPSASSSRQSSQIDTSLYREARPGLHNKSNSTGSAGVTNNTGSPNSEKNQEAQIKELKQRLAAQAKLFQTLQLGPDQLSKCLWQV